MYIKMIRKKIWSYEDIVVDPDFNHTYCCPAMETVLQGIVRVDVTNDKLVLTQWLARYGDEEVYTIGPVPLKYCPACAEPVNVYDSEQIKNEYLDIKQKESDEKNRQQLENDTLIEKEKQNAVVFTAFHDSMDHDSMEVNHKILEFLQHQRGISGYKLKDGIRYYKLGDNSFIRETDELHISNTATVGCPNSVPGSLWIGDGIYLNNNLYNGNLHLILELQVSSGGTIVHDTIIEDVDETLYPLIMEK